MSESRMAQQMGVDREAASDQIVFSTRRGQVSLSRETGIAGVSGEVWVARGWNGLRHGIDPVVTLERFVPQERAERMVGAMLAFSQTDNPVQ